MAYKSIQVKPVAGALGAEIFGADLTKDLDNETFDDIHQAFLDHQVIFFRDQAGLSPERHKAFGRRFGGLNVHPYVKAMDGHPEILEIIKEPSDKLNFGGGWHSDMSFLEQPALGSMLYAVEVPPHGGDTLFASQFAAYDALSDAMKDMLGGLSAVHSASREYSARGASAQKRGAMQSEVAEDAPEFTHPVVRAHPETGRKGLYVNPAFTLRFEGMTKRESKPVLDFLFEHSRYEAFTCRFRWTKDALAFWDNRCVWHFALNDYPGERRHMRRVTINGDRPR
ncbi:MAG: TauD/TfdA family dioxygenase [Pseudomonadota bacterium]